jgi:hypothetical protein
MFERGTNVEIRHSEETREALGPVSEYIADSTVTGMVNRQPSTE